MKMVILAVYIVITLMGLGLLAMVLFGVRSVMFGKVNLVSMAIFAVPVLLLLILRLMVDTWAQAGIWTILLTLGAALIALLVTGVKGLLT